MDEKKPLRIALYCIEVILCFALGGVPGLLPEFMGVLPTLPIACCVSISVFEARNTSIISGAVCGALVDILSGTVIGPMGIVMAILCFVISYVLEEFFQRNILFVLLAVAIGCIVGIFAIYLIYHYGTQGYGEFCLFRIIYTFIFSAILCLLNRKIAGYV